MLCPGGGTFGAWGLQLFFASLFPVAGDRLVASVLEWRQCSHSLGWRVDWGASRLGGSGVD